MQNVAQIQTPDKMNQFGLHISLIFTATDTCEATKVVCSRFVSILHPPTWLCWWRGFQVCILCWRSKMSPWWRKTLLSLGWLIMFPTASQHHCLFSFELYTRIFVLAWMVDTTHPPWYLNGCLKLSNWSCPFLIGWQTTWMQKSKFVNMIKTHC